MGSCFSAIIKIDQCILPNRVNSRKEKKSNTGDSSSSSKNSSKASVHPSSSSTPMRTEDEILKSPNLKSFCFHQLKKATGNFRQGSMVGEGSFGCVFKGWIDEHSFTASKPGTGIAIAVKRHNHEASQGHREWLTEINYLGQLHHPNLVNLIGYCLADDNQLLVYEFMARGSLDNHLFGLRASMEALPRTIRMKIAHGAAKGLACLHSDQVKVIHRDFKSSNILLDEEYNAKLSDFGIAKDGPGESKSHVSTRCMGTQGYLAPEYLASGHLTAKSDVYSFGIVLLEILSGRRVLDLKKPSKEQYLVDWAKPNLYSKRKLRKVMDPRIEGQYPLQGALKAAKLALDCLSPDPKLRPNMNRIVIALEQLRDKNL